MIEDKCPACLNNGYCDCGASKIGSYMGTAFVILMALVVASCAGVVIGLLIVKSIVS